MYFLQIFDKVVFGLGNIYGLSEDLHLVGNQYSLAGSFHAIAQLAWQPFSAYLIVRVPARTLMTFLVFAWGAAAAAMAAAKNHHGIWATRFLLGLFEAGCLPLFSLITAQWYRRSEQPVSLAIYRSIRNADDSIRFASLFGTGQMESPQSLPESWHLACEHK